MSRTNTNDPHPSQYPNTFYRVSVKAIIRDNEGRILVNKEGSSSSWGLPGGGWDHGETEREALARELEEEIGYTGHLTLQLRQTAVFWLESKHAWLLWIVYDVKVDSHNFSTGKHSSEVAFIDPASLNNSTSFGEQWIYENLLKE